MGANASTNLDRPTVLAHGGSVRPATRSRRAPARDSRAGVIASLRHEVVDEALAEEPFRVVDVEEQTRKRRDDAARERLGLERIRIRVKATRAAKKAVERRRERRLPVVGGASASGPGTRPGTLCSRHGWSVLP